MLSEIPERNKTENRYKYEFQIYFLSFRLDKPHLSLMAQCLQCWRLEVNPWVLEDPLEEEMATHPSPQYSCLENPTDRGAWWATVHGVTKSWTRLSN